jgi:hypothetical protein
MTTKVTDITSIARSDLAAIFIFLEFNTQHSATDSRASSSHGMFPCTSTEFRNATPNSAVAALLAATETK